MPLAFPFLLCAALVIAIASGSKSGWRTSAQMARGEGPAPDIQGESPKRWFFWYVLPYGATSYTFRGPSNLTDQEAFELEAETRSASLGVQLFRFVYIYASGTWVYDQRTPPALLGSREIRDQSGNVVGGNDIVGAIALTKHITGQWPYTTLPAAVHLGKRAFNRAKFVAQKPGVVGQYREAVATNAMHLYVLHDGTYVITHLDESNPDMGNALAHLWNDVVKPMKTV
jgi:hypothetical protein